MATQAGYTSEEAKRRIVQLIAGGKSVRAACAAVGRSEKTYEYYRSSDADFATKVDLARGRRRVDAKRVEPGEFADFRRQYLKTRTYWHQHQWIDLMEGKPPRELHPGQTFRQGRKGLLLINTAPEHSKSTTITMDYVTYCLVRDPNERIIIVSKTQKMAQQFVYGVKTRLTSPRYRELAATFGPPGGYKATADSWTANHLYLGSDADRDSGEKDPTLQALGMGGQIYGSRATKIIIDDAVVLSNAHEFEKQLSWITQEVLTRVSDYGRLLVVGTRVAPQDLYSELGNDERYADGESPWTYLSQPAVLEFADDPKDWVTLWPYSEQPMDPEQPVAKTDEDGTPLYERWAGPQLARRRSALTDRRTWAMVYMQQQIAEDAVFPAEDVRACVNGQRVTGPLVPGAVGHRPDGMDGLYVIAGLDPAAVNFTAIVVVGVDRATKKRYVLDVWNQPGVTPGQLKAQIRDMTLRYGVNEWRVEDNAYQTSLIHDEDIKSFVDSRGVILKPHHTGRNKMDPDFGVASMAGLFSSRLIELPATKQNEGSKALVEQLITWAPEAQKRRLKTDTVMALWFTEIRAREICDRIVGPSHVPGNRYLSKRDRERQVVVNLDDFVRAG